MTLRRRLGLWLLGEQFGPRDVVIFKTTLQLTFAGRKSIKSLMKAAFPDHRCFVLARGESIQLMRPHT